MPHKTLMSTATLGDMLVHAGERPERRETLAIIDCRYDLGDDRWGSTAYHAAHIPGAIHASLLHDLSGPLTGHNGRHPLPSVDAMVATFSRMGIAAGSLGGVCWITFSLGLAPDLAPDRHPIRHR